MTKDFLCAPSGFAGYRSPGKARRKTYHREATEIPIKTQSSSIAAVRLKSSTKPASSKQQLNQVKKDSVVTHRAEYNNLGRLEPGDEYRRVVHIWNAMA